LLGSFTSTTGIMGYSPPIETPFPEKATYDGGGGGSNFSWLLSSTPTLRPFGYFFLSSSGTYSFLRSSMNFLFEESFKSLNGPSST